MKKPPRCTETDSTFGQCSLPTGHGGDHTAYTSQGGKYGYWNDTEWRIEGPGVKASGNVRPYGDEP